MKMPTVSLRTDRWRCLSLVLVLVAGTVSADWPQWRGPNRDGHADDGQYLQQWPDGGPTMVWQNDQLGIGYSSPAIVGDRIYTMGSRNGQCHLHCLSAADGSVVWSTPFCRAGTGDDYLDGWGGGPRGTPTVDGDQIFVVSDIGVVAAFDLTGQLQWKVDMVEQFGGEIPKWGYSESPLVDGDKVLVTPGLRMFIVGLDRKTGDVTWTTKGIEEPAQYVSIVKGELDGKPYYVTAVKAGLIGIDANTGRQIFMEPATGNQTAVIPTAVIDGSLIYHTSDYNAGNQLIELSSDGDRLTAEVLYAESAKSMQNHHGGVVLVDGVIYGCSRTNRGEWMAQDHRSGEVLWTQLARPNQSGSIAFADGRLYCYGDKDGIVRLVVPNREGFQQVGELKLPKTFEGNRGSNNRGAIWSHPVVADGMLFIRDQNLMFAFDIAR